MGLLSPLLRVHSLQARLVERRAETPSATSLYLQTGSAFPAWRGSLFSGGLATEDIRRVAFDAQGKVVKQERLEIGKRVRDVRQGPDGALYLVTDERNGELWRLAPKK